METAENSAESSKKRFQKLRKVLNFRNAHHSTEDSINAKSKNEWKVNFRKKKKKKMENLSKPCEVVFSFGNFVKCFSIRYWKLPKTQTGHCS